jgi:septum formation protein
MIGKLGQQCIDSVQRESFPVILASGSPRRKLLLPLVCRVLGSVSPEIDETPLAGESAQALAVRLAELKLARAGSMLASDAHSAILVSADTVVSLDGQPFGKPSNAAEARFMLTALSGRAHTVITAVALGQVGGRRSKSSRVTWVPTEVVMRYIDSSEIELSIVQGDPFDKAGGYAIQDAKLKPVDRIAGCFPNVVGLPLCAIRSMLQDDAGQATFVPTETPCDLCRKASVVLNGHGFWAPQL